LKACDYLERKNYTQAISIFEDISYYKNSAEKIQEAKYRYVLANQNNDDLTTYDYLCVLKNAGYKDSATIYENLYAWKITILGWSSYQNGSYYKSSISKYNPVYCHFTITGGVPGDSTRLSVSGRRPDGKYIDYTFGYDVYDGWTGWYGWSDGLYSYPKTGQTGTILLYFYDESGNRIGITSVRITE
jgi:hypothetical protein